MYVTWFGRETLSNYCKRCYFRVTKFFAFGSTKTYSRVVKFALSRCSLVILVLANIFAGFWIRACWICAKYAKINVPRIFPHFYSMWITIFAGYYSIDDVIGAVIVMKSKLLCANCWKYFDYSKKETTGDKWGKVFSALAMPGTFFCDPPKKKIYLAKMPPLRPPPAARIKRTNFNTTRSLRCFF